MFERYSAAIYIYLIYLGVFSSPVPPFGKQNYGININKSIPEYNFVIVPVIVHKINTILAKKESSVKEVIKILT